MKPLLIVLTGHAPDAIRARLGDFDQWFRLALAQPRERIRVLDVAAGDALPPPRMCAGAVISGSAAMVTDREAWSESTAGWIRDAMDVSLPLFGVCYGHQLMAHALGGRVDYLPAREIGTHWIEHRHSSSADVRLPPRWRAHTTHMQSVADLPPGAHALARSEQDPHQLIRYGEHAMSTQFHPEFGTRAMRAYLRLRATQLRAEGIDVTGLLAATTATPEARAMLRRFGRAALREAGISSTGDRR